MQVGYNHNVKHKGKEYHIQTEDSGKTSMMITTLLYSSGTVIASKKANYAKVAAEYEDYTQQLKELMQKQHKQMLINLKNGDYDDPELSDLDETPEKKATEDKTISDAMNATDEEVNDKPVEPVQRTGGGDVVDVNVEVDRNSSDFAGEIISSFESILKSLTQKGVVLDRLNEELIDLSKLSLRFDDNIALSVTNLGGALDTGCAFILDMKTATTITDLVQLGEGTPKEEMTPDDIDALTELMNQTYGSASQAVLSVYGMKMTYDPIKISAVNAKEDKSALEKLFKTSDVYSFHYSVKIEDKLDSSVYFYLTTDIKGSLKKKEAKEAAPDEATPDKAVPDEATRIISEEEISVTKAEAEVERFDDLGYLVGQGDQAEREFRNIDLIKGIEVNVKIKLGDTVMPLKKISRLAPGTIIELNKDVDSLLELVINNTPIAEGVLVVVSTNNFAIRVTKIINQAERIKRLGGSSI